ncbi:MAG TPA: MFS transporter [Chlamydiales bacterium]|nr:MFS transporter [Chlamydiales bacterium]
MRIKIPRAPMWSACLGNLFEHYDTALFGFLSPFLAPLLFPQHEPLTALVMTYAIIPLGMLARPLGSLFFGYIGDAYGRKQALFLTLTGMAIVSGGIACIPIATALTPLLFFFGRTLQNFLAGGETMGGAIFLLENSPKKRHDFLSGLYSTTTIGGHLLASFGVYLLSRYSIDSGWRLLYLFGCLTALFGCLIRRQVHFPPVQPPPPLGRLFWTHRKPLLSIAIAAGFSAANYSVALVLMNGLLPLITSFTKTQIMQINSYLLIFDLCALPFFGWVASKISREKLMLSAALAVALFGIPLFALLEGASLFTLIAVRTCLVLTGVAFFAPFHAWAQTILPPNARYAVISFGYALGSQLIGGPTAAISLWCYQQTALVSSVSWYWIALSLASALALTSRIQLLEKAHEH